MRDYLADLTGRTRAVLGDDPVGVYAAGSLALIAYQHGRSDIDIAVVVGTSLAPPAKRAIVEALRHESFPCPARGLELVVYRTDVAAAGTADPGFEVELNTGPGMEFRATYDPADRPVQDGTFWYAIDRSILAERGLPVTGPPATEVFRSVPDPELVTLLIASLRWHVDAGDPEESAAWADDAVLNACRAWERIRTGHWSSKLAAGVQLIAEPASPGTGAAAGALDLDRTVVEQALDGRGGGPPPGAPQARRFQRQVLAGLQAVAGGRATK